MASLSPTDVVDVLDADVATEKRAQWEAFSFTLLGDGDVEVTNGSHEDADDHTYTVGVDKRGDVPVPAECECPADVHREPDCKHKLALATIGGATVLSAAVSFEKEPTPLSRPAAEGRTTAADKLQTDGGATDANSHSDACPNGDDRCDGPDGEGLPCFACFEVDQ